MLRISIISALFIATLQIAAEAKQSTKDITFSNISIQDGLSQSTILSACQDRKGNMWFATHDGLNRYDGYEFIIYKHDINDTTTIADNIIRKVYLDDNGNLWIGTGKGLSYYDREMDSFRNISTDGKAVTGIAEDSDGRFMIAAGGSLRFFDSKAWKWEIAAPPCQPETFGATILYKDEDSIWIGTSSDGLFCYSTGSKDIKRVSAFKSGHAIQCILNHDDMIWVATEGDGLHCIDMSSGISSTYHHDITNPQSLSSNYVRSLATDTEGNLWIGTFNGLSIFKNGELINIKSDPFIHGTLSQSSVRCISRDNQGGMWLGTWFGGLNYWHPLRNRFGHTQMQPGENSLNDNVVSCITEDKDGSLWIGTNSGGVNYYNIHTNRYTYYKIESDRQAVNLESNDIKAIYIDNNSGKIFVGAHAGGLNIIDKSRKTIRHNGSSTQLDVYDIIAAGTDKLLLGTLDGMKFYDIVTGEISSVDEDIDGYAIQKLKVRSMMADSQGRLWVGGENGLRTYTINNGQLKKHEIQSSDSPLSSVFIQSFFESSTRTIWIGSRNGLWAYDDKEKKFTHYTSSNGLPSDIIHAIEEDSFGRLWISTDNGISCFNPFSEIFRNFNLSDGLQSNQFNPGSRCKRKNGEILFGGINGISSFDPSKIEDNPFTPQPVITSLEVFNQEVRPKDESGILEKSVMETDRITLKHNQNSFTLKLSVPNYLSGKHNTFAYKLEGYDKQWYEINDRRTITYSNIPHGTYNLMVKAANNDGKWNETPTCMGIEIKPIWYRSYLAVCIWILLLSALFVALYRFLIDRKEKESRLELEKQEKAHQEEIHQMKMRFFINISHEMRTPLTLIINPLSEMISKSSDTWIKKQLKYVERNARRLLHLVNQLMDYRRAELGVFKLRVQQENIHKIIKENWSFYEKLAQSKNIRYSLISEVEGKAPYIDGQYLELILNNLISNAFKYTDEGSITVKVYEKTNELVVEVSDTGSGIPNEQQSIIFERFYQVDNEHIGSGIGLSLIQRLVELHHGTISLQSEVGKGSTFTVSLPSTPEAYSQEELEGRDTTEAHTSNRPDLAMLDSNPEDDNCEVGDGNTKKRGRLLIAEDNEEIRAYMKEGLSKLFDIMLAKNGEEALQMLKDNETDIVITDMMMPVMDGLKLCSHIKQNIATGHIPVIMLSAKTDKKDELEALKTGADDYIAKPFSMTLLIAKIQNILRTQYRLQDKVSKSMEIAPEKISFNALDEQILTRAINIVQENIDNAEFSTEEFAKAMNMSRSNLHLKLKALTGESALDFIRKIRFKEACRLLKDGRYSISEISYMVGFNTPSYFATCFKKYIGCLPTEYIKKH